MNSQIEMAWTAYGSAIYNNDIWYINYWGKKLCRYSLLEHKMKSIEIIPYEGKRNELLYSNVSVVNEKLILTPANSFDICIYDINSREFELVPLVISAEEYNLFSGCVVNGRNAYFIPYNFKSIVKMNLETKEISYLFELDKIVAFDHERIAFQYNYIAVGQTVYFFSGIENVILAFDMATDTIKTERIGDCKTVFSAVTKKDDRTLLLVDQEGNVYEISLDLNQIAIYRNNNKDYELVRNGLFIKAYADAFNNNQKTYFLPGHANMILEFDWNTNCINHIENKLIDELAPLESHKANAMKISLIQEYKGSVYGFYISTGQLFEYEKKTHTLHLYDTLIELEEAEARILMKKLLKNGVLQESNYVFESLDTFLRIISE